MTSEEEKQISALNHRLNLPVDIQLITNTDERSEGFLHFCDDLERLAPNVRVQRKKNGDILYPAIHIGDRIRYHAIPSGPEMAPFLDALKQLSRSSTPLSPELTAILDQLNTPASLDLFIAPHCPHCPVAVREWVEVALTTDWVTLNIIDGILFPEAADTIRSAPTLVLDGDFRWAGRTPVGEILSILVDRNPAQLSAQTFETMLGEGDAGRVAELICREQMIFQGFADLFSNEKWPVRLGAMVAMEIVADRDPKLAETAIALLWDRFDTMPDVARGDALYIFGAIGSRRALPLLETVRGGDYSDDIREAAQEALESILESGCGDSRAGAGVSDFKIGS